MSKTKRSLGIGAIVVGAIMVVFSFIIKAQVAEGEGKISSAKESVGRGQGLFNMSPATKSLGDTFTSGANSKIMQGEADIAFYTKVSNVLLIGGVILIVVGGGSIFFGKKSAR